MLIFSFSIVPGFPGDHSGRFHLALSIATLIFFPVLVINLAIWSGKLKKNHKTEKDEFDMKIMEYQSCIDDLFMIVNGLFEASGMDSKISFGSLSDIGKIKKNMEDLRKAKEEYELANINSKLDEKNHKANCVNVYMKIPELTDILREVIKETEKSTFTLIDNFEKVSIENTKAKDESRKNLEKIKHEIGNRNLDSFLEESKKEIDNYENQITSLMLLFNSLLSYNKDDEKKLMKFGEWIDNIGEILNSINDISDRNRLIAINTSIEASKFGEKGKGFQVLTMEIQKLNESTNAFIKNINRIMESFREYNKSFVNEWSLRTQDMINKIEKNENQSEKIISRLVNSYSLSTTSFIRLTESTDIIDKNLTQLLESLQFQDIVKQQIEKVISFLNELNTTVEEQIKSYDVDGENDKTINEIVEKTVMENKVILF
jgi:methyl-accepting chemotaxis protein